MSKFTLTIKLGDDAMRTGADVARALRTVAGWIEDRVHGNKASSPIYDENGNKVGTWSVEFPEEDPDVAAEDRLTGEDSDGD